MKILAIWDRYNVAPKSISVFVLLQDRRLLFVSPETLYVGTDAESNRLYKETGNVEYWSAFDDEDRFDFQKADYYIRHFGGSLIKNFATMQYKK